MSLQPLPTHPSSSFPTSLLFSGQSFTVQCTDGKGEEDTDSRNSHLLNHLIQFLRQFSSVQSCPTLCDPMDCSTPGFSVHHQLLDQRLAVFEKCCVRIPTPFLAAFHQQRNALVRSTCRSVFHSWELEKWCWMQEYPWKLSQEIHVGD